MAQAENEFRTAVTDWDKVEQCNAYLRDEDYEKAFKLAGEQLELQPDAAPFLAIASTALLKTERYTLASVILKKALQLEPEVGFLWNNLGNCLMHIGHANHEPDKIEQARECFRKALDINVEDPHPWNNLAILAIHECEPDDAITFCKRVHEIDPTFTDPCFNRALGHLMKGEWSQGWRFYDYQSAARFKKESHYGISKWDGRPGQRVVVYGEQGIGDEIMFASIIPDALRDATLILDCDSRLEGIYKRSFDCEVHGTRYKKENDWFDPSKVDSQLPIGSLARLYRNSDADFPRQPFFVADPELRTQYRALLDSLGPRPKIGLAWSGGIRKTFETIRSLDLKALEPILQHDADFISLQYKNIPDDPRIHHWPHIVEAHDYDHTAALVAELDLVITVTTALVHLCGSLGKECWVLTPEKPQWRYVPPDMIWYSSVELFRQEGGKWPITDISERLSLMGIERTSASSIERTVTVSPPSDTAPLSAVS